jgi:hypothetical protein
MERTLKRNISSTENPDWNGAEPLGQAAWGSEVPHRLFLATILSHQPYLRVGL